MGNLRAMPCLSFPRQAPGKTRAVLRETPHNDLRLSFPVAGSFALLNSLCKYPFLTPLPSRAAPSLEIRERQISILLQTPTVYNKNVAIAANRYEGMS